MANSHVSNRFSQLLSLRLQLICRVVRWLTGHRACAWIALLMRFSLTAIATIGAALAACASERPSARAVVRDSVGVTIIESQAPLWGEGDGWTLSDEPVVTIGLEEGPEEYALHQVAGALRLPTGRILIANNGTDELRYYDSSGVYLYSVGRDGYGPGEFKRMRGIWLFRDSLVIHDSGQDRVSVFTASGEYERTMMLDREPGSLNPATIGVFSDGSILARAGVMDRSRSDTTGMRFERTNAVYRRYSLDGSVLNTLGVFLWTEALIETRDSRVDAVTGVGYSSAVAASPPFGRHASTIASGHYMYHASSDSYEIQVYSKDGTLERLIRRPIPNAPVTAADRNEFREHSVGDDPRFQSWARSRVDELVYPDTKPAYGTVKVDAVGNIWVADFSLGNDDASVNWTVFACDGRMLGVIRIPPGGRIHEIGREHLLGMWRTELDVEQVRMYRLFKN